MYYGDIKIGYFIEVDFQCPREMHVDFCKELQKNS